MEQEDFTNDFIKRRLQEAISEYSQLPHSHLQNYASEVEELIHHGVLFYLRYIIHKMAQHKRKYTIVCPVLTGEEIDETGNYMETKVIYGENPFTAEDLFECFQTISHLFSKRDVFQVAMMRILSKTKESALKSKEEDAKWEHSEMED